MPIASLVEMALVDIDLMGSAKSHAIQLKEIERRIVHDRLVKRTMHDDHGRVALIVLMSSRQISPCQSR